MAYDLENFATDAGALTEEWTDQEKALGFLCGQFELGKLNTIIRDIFADIKAVHDLDDFLNGLQIVADPNNPGKYLMNVDLNEIEDSQDSTLSLSMFSEDVVNVGGGLEWFRNKTGTDLNFRTLQKTGRIVISQQADTITIGYDETFLQNQITSNDQDIASLNNQVASNDNDIQALDDRITDVEDNYIDDGNSVGTGNAVYKDKTGNTLNFKSIALTGALSMSDSGDTLTIGNAQTYSNVGAGQDVLKGVTGNDVQFRGVSGAGDVSVTTSGDNIVVGFTETHSQFLVDSVAKTLTHINENGDQVVADLNALLPEVYVNGATLSADVLTLTDNDTGTPDIVVNFASLRGSFSSAGGVYTYDSGNGTTYNIDTNASALPVDDTNLGFTAGNVQQALEGLQSLINGSVTNGQNVGDGLDVFKQKSGSNLQFRGVKTVGGATSQVAADNIEIHAGRVHALANLNGGSTGRSIYQGELVNGSNQYIARLRELVGGDGIEITENTNTLNFSINETTLAANLVSALFNNAAFKQAFYQLFAAGFQDDGNGNLQIADGGNASGNPTFTACP